MLQFVLLHDNNFFIFVELFLHIVRSVRTPVFLVGRGVVVRNSVRIIEFD